MGVPLRGSSVDCECLALHSFRYSQRIGIFHCKMATDCLLNNGNHCFPLMDRKQFESEVICLFN